MGAFIIISLILFPYFPNTGVDPRDIEKIKKELTEEKLKNQKLQAKIQKQKQGNQTLSAQNKSLQNKNRQVKRQAARLQSELQKQKQVISTLEERLRQSFLVVIIEWNTKGNDIDLHVKDPEGNEFYYKKTNIRRRHFPGSPASLSYDRRKGPGMEVWQHPKATPGRYRIYAKYYRGSVRTKVTGNVFVRNKRVSLRPVTLTRKGQKLLLATIVVNPNGDVRVVHP